MAYPYGMQGVPKVGNGLGGLPQRDVATKLPFEPVIVDIKSGSGQYVVPKGVKFMRVSVVGGGGGGRSGYGSGAGGGLARSEILPAYAGLTIDYVVGAGGTGGNSSDTGMSDGGVTTAVFRDITLQATGGKYCTAVGKPAPGGVGTGGKDNYSGGAGGYRSGSNAAVGGGGGAAGYDGNGAAGGVDSVAPVSSGSSGGGAGNSGVANTTPTGGGGGVNADGTSYGGAQSSSKTRAWWGSTSGTPEGGAWGGGGGCVYVIGYPAYNGGSGGVRIELW